MILNHNKKFLHHKSHDLSEYLQLRHRGGSFWAAGRPQHKVTCSAHVLDNEHMLRSCPSTDHGTRILQETVIMIDCT